MLDTPRPVPPALVRSAPDSNLASNEYFMPIMGLLFLRQATNRYYAALEAIEADRKAGRMANRRPVAADFARRRALMLAPSARCDEILKTPKDGNLGAVLIAAMEEIERAYHYFVKLVLRRKL